MRHDLGTDGPRTPRPGMTAAGWWIALLASGVATVLVVRLRRVAVQAARAGHEVRGPLCAALLGVERLDRGGSPDPATLAAVELELRRAALALDDLGRRRTRPRPLGEPVDLGDLLTAASAGWNVLAGAHGAQLSVDAEPGGLLVDGDRLRIAQACGNLVANAIEHGGGEVRVRARALGPAVRVEVTDGGPGLPASVGTLVAGARHRRGRRGHGLAVAAQVADRHGGRLAAGPSPRGARLVLELPAARAMRSRAGP
jgi:signal transduction histidine kinase